MHFIYFYVLHIHMSIYSNFSIRGHLIWQNEKSEIHQKPCHLTPGKQVTEMCGGREGVQRLEAIL